MMQWVLRSIPHGGPIKFFLVPSIGITPCYPGYGMVCIRDPCYMLSWLWDGVYKRSLLHAILVMGWCV